MKLILQVAAGVVLGWLVISAGKMLIAHSALAHLGSAIERPPTPTISPQQGPSNPSHERPYEAPPVSGSLTREQLDAYIRADEAHAKAEHEAHEGSAPEQPAATIRKATPEDAAAKPAK
jgi:hypothetical protein